MFRKRALIDFSRRSTEAEQIDFPDLVPAREMETTLHELRLVNTWLGGAAGCLESAKPLLADLAATHPGRKLRVVDFGSGGADIPIAVVKWARQRGWPIQVLAVDFNLVACRFAKSAVAEYPEIVVVCGDVLHHCLRPGACHLAVFSAFLHHFTDTQIAEILAMTRRLVSGGIVINDLQRSRWAYVGIRALTWLFSKSEAVRNDGPLSVLRGFRRRELREILRRGGFSGARIDWRWAFRYVVTIPLGLREPQTDAPGPAS